VSCYSCHQIEAGGADQRSRPLATSLGANYGVRNSPTVINVALTDVTHGGWQLWDGRKDSLWAQAIGPMEGPNEAAGSRLQFAHIIYDHYRAEYENVFGPMPELSDVTRFPVTGKPGQASFDNMAPADKVAINRVHSNVGKAIEAFERRLVSTNFQPSPFDRMLAGDESGMTAGAIRGARLFIGKAACNECHRGPMFSDGKFHNIGCPQTGQNVPTVDVGRTKGIMTVKNDVFNRSGMFSDDPQDGHLVNLAEQEIDVGAFKTPSLRNIEKTAPYMHDGVYTTMWDVVAHYNFGGGTGTYSGKKESAVSPLNLTDREMDDLVEFLRSLSDGAPLGMDIFPEGLLAAPVLPE
jgi:cytochrome c peroxidase